MQIIYIILIFILVFYLYGREVIFVRFDFIETTGAVTAIKVPTRMQNSCWKVYASEDILSVPVGQWREIPVNLRIHTLKIKVPFTKISLLPFGFVGIRVHTLYDRATKGCIVHEYIGKSDSSQEDGIEETDLRIILFNNGSYPVRIRKGDPVAQIEFYRINKVVVL